jgi:hypothetical protein
LTEGEKRRRLKELGYVRSVSATASCELEFDKFAVNRQAAQEDRPDALGKLIESILSEALELPSAHVLKKLKRDYKGKITMVLVPFNSKRMGWRRFLPRISPAL